MQRKLAIFCEEINFGIVLINFQYLKCPAQRPPSGTRLRPIPFAAQYYIGRPTPSVNVIQQAQKTHTHATSNSSPQIERKFYFVFKI